MGFFVLIRPRASGPRTYIFKPPDLTCLNNLRSRWSHPKRLFSLAFDRGELDSRLYAKIFRKMKPFSKPDPDSLGSRAEPGNQLEVQELSETQRNSISYRRFHLTSVVPVVEDSTGGQKFGRSEKYLGLQREILKLKEPMNPGRG